MSKMVLYQGKRRHGVLIDTNILIYLFEPKVLSTEVFNRFLTLVISQRIKLIIPEQVKREWDKHKSNKLGFFLDTQVKEIEKHRKLVQYIESEDKREELMRLINELRKMTEREFRYTYAIRNNRIDSIIADEFHTDIPGRNSRVDESVVRLSIDKEAPFFGPDDRSQVEKTSKNQMQDAVIFFSAIDHMQSHADDYDRLFFVSGNKKDFSKHGNDAQLHPNLQPYADQVGMEFYNDLVRFLNAVDPEKKYLHEFISENPRSYLTDEYFEECNKCEKEVHKNADLKVEYPPLYPQGVYKMVCPHCKEEWSTGESTTDHMY